uniref:FecR domain-containing protein n=1 Tax=Klebsiella pneumoniae TaxID=573 RepID=UPI002739BF7F
TMKIETTKPGEASIVDLVGGQIRAKVTKDPLLGGEGADAKEKMIVKTKTAAMGIRGTDFNVSFNKLNNITALVTFEGNVAMAKLAAEGAAALAALHQPSGVQSVGAGQFSGVQPDQPQASIPVKISPAQLDTLKGNTDFKGLGEKGQKQAIIASPIPPGVD